MTQATACFLTLLCCVLFAAEEQWMVLAQTTPAFGDVAHRFAASLAQHRAADEHRRTQRGFQAVGISESASDRKATRVWA